LGRKRPFLALVSGLVFSKALALAANGRDFWEKIFRAILGGVLPACGGRLEDSRERKPARRHTHDYGRFFVETVPKRYTFGTGTPPKRLNLRGWNGRKTWCARTKPSPLSARAPGQVPMISAARSARHLAASRNRSGTHHKPFRHHAHGGWLGIKNPRLRIPVSLDSFLMTRQKASPGGSTHG
jgi:hypothetical protein